MKKWIFIISLILTALSATSNRACGQPKAISTIWSFDGIGVGYEHFTSDGDFIQIDIKGETNDIFIKKRWIPAATASLTFNMTFAECTSRNGNTVYFFAGPGAVGGWGKDNNEMNGAIFGIKGRIGAECRFSKRHVTVSASIAPELGMHISMKDGTSYMRLYRNGLLQSIMPEIGIKYAF